ncbi:DUF3693 domain-containing protein [Vibrio cortegadensis]|uniref:DUF3693 domain-containing protein n=1 Tax=Vibrio cortegadensis TaxID=1328770 RepID=UPI0021C33297|nr:DUF3693 domain-containing protein [Vibrio cortegadensis]MDN3696832.1 DUF3693 domain-containing protein [Vibrio cortegadensis]
MYTSNLLDAYKEHMKFVQDKQIAHELGLSPQMITEIRKGRSYLKENKALFIADQIGEDKEKVLIGLAADRAKTTEEQALWSQISKKFEGLGLSGISMACGTLVLSLAAFEAESSPLSRCVLCVLC